MSTSKSHDAIVVFTGKTKERILEQGGTSSWVLQRAHALQCEYVVCTRNAKAPDEDWTGGRGSEDHGSAFIVGRISGIVPSPNTDAQGRWLIKFSEYAEVAMPNVWKGRNPVQYTTLEALEIDPTALEWKPMPTAAASEVDAAETNRGSAKPPNLAEVFAETKRGLALKIGVPVDAIEITVRG